MAFKDADVRTGVRWILGAMRACAARMTSQLGSWQLRWMGLCSYGSLWARKRCRCFTFSAFSDAVKEAFWHVDAHGYVPADDLSPREIHWRTGTSWPCQV